MGSVIARKYFMICLNRGLAKGSGFPWRSDPASDLWIFLGRLWHQERASSQSLYQKLKWLLLITFEKWSKLRESSIRHVIKPTLDKDAVIWLQLEILCHVIHNDGAG